MTVKNKETVGQLNGKWARLFKINNAISPFVIFFLGALLSLNIWLISSVMKNNAHRDTATQICIQVDKLVELHRSDMQYLEHRLDSMPSSDWKDRVSRIEEKLDIAEDGISEIRSDVKVIRQMVSNVQAFSSKAKVDDPYFALAEPSQYSAGTSRFYFDVQRAVCHCLLASQLQ